jgi:DNA-binding GntR family transcriptional regulator
MPMKRSDTIAARGKLLKANAKVPSGKMAITDTLRKSMSVVRSLPTLREQALEKLRGAIIEGHLPPGTRLVERNLCELLGVSRTLVREILRQLEAEGWIQNPPYKGPTVATVSSEEAQQIYEMRGALEGLAARLCAQRATPSDIEQLEQIVDAMEAAEKNGDLNLQMRCIEQFYDTLLEAAGNKMLTAYLASQRSRLFRLRSVSLNRPARSSISVVEKRRLVAAIRNHDGAAAQRASEEHIEQAAIAATAAFVEMEKSAFAGTAPARARAQKKPRAR